MLRSSSFLRHSKMRIHTNDSNERVDNAAADDREGSEKSRYEHLMAQSFGPESFVAPLKYENRSRLQRKRDSKREKAAGIRRAAEAKAKSEELRMRRVEQRRKAKAEKKARREVERNMRGGIAQVESTIVRRHHALDIILPPELDKEDASSDPLLKGEDKDGKDIASSSLLQLEEENKRK